MLAPVQAITVELFDSFVEQPENAGKVFEFIAGEAYEVPSNAYASKISSLISGELYVFLRGKNLGHLTGEAGGYQIAHERYAPDVAFVSRSRQEELDKRGYNHIPPDLAVEVDFPSDYDSQKRLRKKIVNYLAEDTVVWLVIPESKTVEVYRPHQPVQTLTGDATLKGEGVLSGFELPLRVIFG